jgi:hypothetical protein
MEGFGKAERIRKDDIPLVQNLLRDRDTMPDDHVRKILRWYLAGVDGNLAVEGLRFAIGLIQNDSRAGMLRTQILNRIKPGHSDAGQLYWQVKGIRGILLECLAAVSKHGYSEQCLELLDRVLHCMVAAKDLSFLPDISNIVVGHKTGTFFCHTCDPLKDGATLGLLIGAKTILLAEREHQNPDMGHLQYKALANAAFRVTQIEYPQTVQAGGDGMAPIPISVSLEFIYPKFPFEAEYRIKIRCVNETGEVIWLTKEGMTWRGALSESEGSGRFWLHYTLYEEFAHSAHYFTVTPHSPILA